MCGKYECFIMQMLYACVHPVTVVSAAFCMTCSLLMLVINNGIDGNTSKPLFSKMENFQETQKNDFKSSYFFLICDHLHNDATLGCKYSVYIKNLKNMRIFSKRINFSII